MKMPPPWKTFYGLDAAKLYLKVLWLFRALQTAVGVFGGEGYTDRMDILPLMVANAGYSERPSISSLNCPPIIAIELCREHLVCLLEIKMVSSLQLIMILTESEWIICNLLWGIDKPRWKLLT